MSSPSVSSASSSPALRSINVQIIPSETTSQDLVSGALLIYSLDANDHWYGQPESWSIAGPHSEYFNIGSSYMFAVTGACFNDLSFNVSHTQVATKVCQAPGERMRAVVTFTGNEQTVTISPLTEIAASLANYHMSLGVSSGNAIALSNAAVSSWAGVDVISTRVGQLTLSRPTIGDSENYATLLLGFGSWVRNIVDPDPAATFGISSYTPSGLLAVISTDIGADGVLDGLGGSTPLTWGKWPAVANDYRHQTAAYAMRSLHWLLDTGLRNNATKPEQYLQFVKVFNDYSGSLFALPSSISLDEGGPTIIYATLPTTPVTLDYAIALRYEDIAGVTQGGIQVLVDDQLYSTPSVPVFSVPATTTLLLNTTIFTNGAHKVTVRITNLLGSSVSQSAIMNFQNDCSLWPRACT